MDGSDPVFVEHCLLIPIMVDLMIDCLLALRDKAGILHRNISVNNILYEVKDGKYNFVLVDFDMATHVTRGAEPGDPTFIPICTNITGTLPFMARELIRDAYNRKHLDGWTPVLHRLRHDLESLFYVSIWCLCSFVHWGLTDEQKDELKSAMLAWERADSLLGLLKLKGAICTSGHGLVLSRAAAPLGRWLRAWEKALNKVTQTTHDCEADASELVGTDPLPFDWETLNGTFTATVLKDALSPQMPVDATETVSSAFKFAAAYSLVPGGKP